MPVDTAKSTAAPDPVLQLNIAGNDPLVRALVANGVGVRSLLVVAILALGAAPLAAAWQAGTFVNPSLRFDALHDIGFHNQSLLLAPFLVLFIPYYLNGLVPALNELKATGTIIVEGSSVASFVSKANAAFGSPWVTFPPYMLGVSIVAFAAWSYWLRGLGTWNSPADTRLSLSVVLSAPPAFALYYLVGALVTRIVASSRVIAMFMKYQVQSSALHPDGVGGFAPLGRFSIRVAIAAIVGGVVVVIGVWSTVVQYGRSWLSTDNLLMWFGYMTALTVAFFMPAWPAGRKMREVKDETLNRISRRAIRIMDDTLYEVDSDEKISTGPLEDIRKLWRVASRMPVYPFNLANMVKFAGSVIWPLLTLVLQSVLAKL